MSIETLQQHAMSKGGKLLSDNYCGSLAKHCWQCSKGHIWDASWSTIHKGCWCPVCGSLNQAEKCKTPLRILQQHATDKGGKLLSIEYKKSSIKLMWQCSKGHTWDALWGDVHRGSWCPNCAKNALFSKRKIDISILHKAASSHGGLLLSESYIDAGKTKLTWQCNKGHQWNALWGEIKRGHWCPDCASFKTETQVRILLENELKIPVVKTTFMYNNNRYQFDGYNEEHKIAFEYHGIQHYKYPNYWHKTEELFKQAQQRDKIKEQYCIINGIKLLVIPYTETKNLNLYINNLVHSMLEV